jgi:uncharacterized membrane protein
MKKYFSTGLGILLPAILTFLIIGFLINFLTRPFLTLTESLIIQSNIFTKPFLFFNESTLIIISSKLIILLAMVALIFIVGVIGKLFLIHYIFQFGDYLLNQVPVINKIYKGSKDVVNSLFSSSSNSFSQVVFVPFPSTNNLSIGLVTKDALLVNTGRGEEEVVPVYIPGTPNPTVGFMLMFKKHQLIYSTMKADEAMKFVVSCGIVMPDFSTSLTPETKNE